MKKPAFCPNPSYGRVLGGDVLAGLVSVVTTVVGAGVGIAVAAAAPGPVEGRSRRLVAGGAVGGALGFVGGIYPSLIVQKGTLQTNDCPNPKMSDLLGYNLARAALIGLVQATGKATNNHAIATAANAGAFFLAPLVGRQIVKTS